ncbi:MAG: YncE family protein, partial [Acidobacteriota bacterium]|nr:YncE family protein [Acidobacteriota bacterium]
MKQVHIRAFSLLLTLFLSIPLGLFAYADRSDLSGEATVSADSSFDVPYSVAQHGETETITATLQGESLDEADTPFQASTELSVDDGSFETALGLNQPGTIYLINRLRPPSYPATLVQLRIPFRTNDNLTVGSSITLLVGTNPDGDADIDGTSFQQFSGTIQSLGQFNLYNTPAVTINAGDFVVGFRMTIPANVFPGALDTSSPSRRSYASTNGVNFTLVDDINNNVPDGDLGIRAIVNLQTSSAQTGALLASYVSNNDTGTGDLTTIRDLTTGQLGTTILTQGNNAEVVVAPNGQYALALPTGNGDSVSIITGLNQPNPVESRVLPIGNTPNAAAITPDSSTAIVFNAFTNPVSYRIISNLPFNPSVSPLFTIPNTVTGNNSGVEDVALSPSGDTAIVSLFDDDEVAIIDGIRSGSPFVRGRVDVRDGPNGVAFGPDGNTAFVACSLDDSICVVSGLRQGVQPFFVRRIRDNVRDTPQAIALVPGRSRIIVTNTGDNSVSIFRIVGNGDDLQHVQRLSVGSAPAGLDVSQDGSAALVANANSRTVSVLRGIDTSSPYVAATLGGSSPWDTAVFAERSIAFVSGVTGTGGGILDVSTTSLTFNTQVGDTTPPSQQFLVRNTGNSAFSYSISNNNPSLVTLSPDSGFLQPGQSNVITVFVTPPTSAGTRQAVLTVSAPGAQNSPRTVTVIVNTTGAPAILDVSPTSLTF